MLRGPALGLQIVAYAGGGINVLFLILNLAGAVSIEGVSGGKKALSCVAGALITGVWVTLVAKGAAAMSSQYSYPMAITGCFVAMVPCSWGFLGGIPIGIWGLVILFREEVKREFR